MTMTRLSGHRKLTVLLAVLSTALTGCSKSDHKPQPPFEAKSPFEIKPPVEITGPLVSMTVASSIDDKGKPVNPRFTFPPNEPQIAVLVQLGKTDPSTLTVTWYRKSDDDSADKKLFEHQVQVKSYGYAFSIGKNPGPMLQPGRYKVVATLAGETKEIVFDISLPNTTPKNSSRNTSPLYHQLQFEADGLFRASEYRQAEAESLVRKVVYWNPSDLPPAPYPFVAGMQPPVPGQSGTYGKLLSGKYPGGCGVVIYGPPHEPEDLVADTVEIYARGWCEPDSITAYVLATVNGPRKEIGEFATVVGLGWERSEKMFGFDPCSLSGGSDLPGTRITASADFADQWHPGKAKTGHTVLILGKDTLAPLVSFASTPISGSKVEAREKIAVKITATEQKAGGSWQTGVKRIQVTAGRGELVKEPWVNSASPESQTCSQKTWKQEYEATYTIPDNPPQIVTICGLAEDYAGNPGYSCADFYTTDRWLGTLREHAQGNIYNDTVEVHFSFNEEPDGTIKGSGRVNKMTSEPVQFGNHTITRTLHIKPDEAEFPISGKRVGDEFQLDLQVPKGPTIKVDIESDNGTTEGARSVFVSEPSYHPKVKAQEGATNSFHTNLGGKFQVDATIEIHRAKR